MLHCGCTNKRRITGKAKHIHFTLSRALELWLLYVLLGGEVIILITFVFVCVLSVRLYSVLRSFKLALIPYPFLTFGFLLPVVIPPMPLLSANCAVDLTI